VSRRSNTTSSGSDASGSAAVSGGTSPEIGEAPKAPRFVALNSVAREEPADPIIGIRVALNPIVRRADGTTELLGEIAAEVFEVPEDWSHVQQLELRWKGRDAGGWLHLEYGPDFNMVPDLG
jgi:hypothetical protein